MTIPGIFALITWLTGQLTQLVIREQQRTGKTIEQILADGRAQSEINDTELRKLISLLSSAKTG
jgi:hypothetical protein